jgi:hypothetical protein
MSTTTMLVAQVKMPTCTHDMLLSPQKGHSSSMLVIATKLHAQMKGLHDVQMKGCLLP